MAGHERLLELPDAEFRRQVLLLEAAFESLSAAFSFDGESGHSIDVFDFFAGVDDVDEWVELRTFANDLQEMVFFAFERAPSSIVRSWGEDHVEGAGEVAVERVQFIRENLVTARSEWVARFSDLARTLGDVKTTHVFDEDLEAHKTAIRIDSFFAEGLRRVPSASSREYVTAVLTRNELRRLIDKLRMADFRYEQFDDSTEDVEDQDVADAEGVTEAEDGQSEKDEGHGGT